MRAGNVAAVVRGHVLAAPLLLVFGALFMSAVAVFSEWIVSVVQSFERSSLVSRWARRRMR